MRRERTGSLRALLPIVVAAAVAAAACSPRGKVAGRYTHARAPEEWIELASDGSYVLDRSGTRTTGSWELAGDGVSLRPPGGFERALLDGRFLVAADGDRWVRRWPAGHYAHPRQSGYFVDLRPDGSYHFARGDNDHRGRYDVAGPDLTLWYPSDGRCTTGGEGPAVPSPGLCAFLAEVRDDRLTFFRLKGEPGKPIREPGEEFVLKTRME